MSKKEAIRRFIEAENKYHEAIYDFNEAKWTFLAAMGWECLPEGEWVKGEILAIDADHAVDMVQESDEYQEIEDELS